ncbi:MAG TPA: TIGR03620 family F420-dependent LLM class oxidoreductase [Conexibacter sp.]|jgi:probable F420-dependent oxidoreductase
MSDSPDPTTLADAARKQLGPTGIWLSSLGGQSAAVEREAAAELDQLGYRALWFGETPRNKEAFVHAGLLLGATERLVIATGIANIWARDAAATHQAANTLGEAYPGRFVLGLGVSHAPLVDSRGHSYRRPLAAMTQYLDALDAAEYAPPLPAQPVPLVLAALRQRMLELSRDRTAGAHPYLTTVEHTAQARELLGQGPLLAPEVTVVLERDPQRAREIARPFLAGYIAMSNYVNNWRELGFNDEDLADGGSDRLVDALVGWGDEEAVLARVRAHHEAGADHVAIQPLGSFEESMAQLRALAPALVA